MPIAATGERLANHSLGLFGGQRAKNRSDPSALVEAEVEVAVDRIQPESTYRASERVERPTHVDRLDRDEHADAGGEAQHERSARTRRTRDASRKSSESSIAISPTRTT